MVVSADIASFLLEWTRLAAQPQSGAARDYPTTKVYRMVDTYINELAAGQQETQAKYAEIKQLLYKHW